MSTPDIGLANWFLQRALRTPERTALAFEGQTWSYAQMQQRIEQLAGRLHGLGVKMGDRVVFIGLNQPMFLFALFASARLGAIFVPLNFRLTAVRHSFFQFGGNFGRKLIEFFPAFNLDHKKTSLSRILRQPLSAAGYLFSVSSQARLESVAKFRRG
jgi:hypothetical protein